MKTNHRLCQLIQLTIIVILASANCIPFHPLSTAPTFASSRSGNTHFSLFGSDDRNQISSTQQFPYSAVSLVRIYWSAKDLVGYSCTGFMIGPSTLATAAHCIYKDGYPYRVVVKPAMNSDAAVQMPFGSCNVTSWVVPDAWVKSHNMNYDYGVYQLDCSIGLQTGTLGFKLTSGDWTRKSLQLTGYPNDKEGRTMWTGLGKVTSTSAKGLFYDIDMWPGQSGSPVWDDQDPGCAYCVVAVNSSQFEAPLMNFGVRIDQEAFDFLAKEIGIRSGSTLVLPKMPEDE